MSIRTVPNYRKLKVADLAHPCPEAGGRSRTRQPRGRLDRWMILRDLLADAWANPGIGRVELLDRHLGSLSPLEADLIRRMFLNVERIFPVQDAEIDLEGASIAFDDDRAGVTTSVHVTFRVTHADGSVEMVRLKTGRSSSSTEEAAVLWAGAEEGETFTDLMAWPGEVEELPVPSDLEDRLRVLVEESPALQASGVRPGPACVWCARAALCGAFPSDRIVPTSARTVNLTKTDVEGLGQCRRRVAWRRVHGIPRDDGDDDASPAVSQGRLLHALVAAAESSDTPTDTVTDFLLGVAPSEVADMRMMWEHHRHLMDAEGIGVRRLEFPVGLTILEGERADIHGVTIIGFLDMTARDAAGRPVAVEIKTGSPGDTEIEDDLYAVGLRRWIGPDDPIVIHRHYVRPSPPVCETVELESGVADLATERLRRRVAVVSEWDWEDPLAVHPSVGPWCGGCEFRLTCESYRA